MEGGFEKVFRYGCINVFNFKMLNFVKGLSVFIFAALWISSLYAGNDEIIGNIKAHFIENKGQ